MRITKVYTKTGDKGLTGLVGGQRVPKNHVRIKAYGTVDELNAILGLARVWNLKSTVREGGVQKIDLMLKRVQNDLFNLGADLATRPEDRWPGMYLVGDQDVQQLEEWIDELNDALPPLKDFILPGGGPVGAFLHQARTVCRRGERDLLDLMDQEEQVGDGPMRYLNRLSDFLFVLGRWVAKALGEEEYLWERP